MEKLQMCRICLVKNIRMYVVVNKNLHELYEKLTDVPFVTEDSRPILVCFVCCTKLKQCFQFRSKCLEAEELFAQMIDEDYEPNPSINPDHLVVFGGFVKSAVVHTSIVDECQTGSIAINERLPADCEGQDNNEPSDKNQSDDIELESVGNSRLNLEDMDPHHANSEGDVPFIEVSVKVEELPEVSERNQTPVETNNLEPENVDNSCLDVEYIPPDRSDSEADVPLIHFKTGVEEAQEVPKKKRRAMETKSAPVSRRSKRLKLQSNEDTITAEQKIVPSNLKVFRTTRNRTSKPGTSFKERYKCDRPGLNGVKKFKHRLRTRICEIQNAITVEQKNEPSNLKVFRTTRNRTSKPGTSFKEPYSDRPSLNGVQKLKQHSRTRILKIQDTITAEQKNEPSNMKVFRTTRNRTSKPGTSFKEPHSDLPSLNGVQKLKQQSRTRIREIQDTITAEQKNEPSNFKVFRTSRNRTSKPGTSFKEPHSDRPSLNGVQKLKQHSRTRIREIRDTITAEQKNEPSNLKVFRTTRNRTSKPGTSFKEPYLSDRPSLNGVKKLKQHSRDRSSLNGVKKLKQLSRDRPSLNGVKKLKQLSRDRPSLNGVKKLKQHSRDRPSLNGVKKLKQHSRAPTCEIPSKCDFCERIFSDKNKLAIHVRTHTGEKPYTCDVCQRSFSQTSHLKKHIRIHTGEKPYKCDICQRSFSVKGSLTEHIRVHTGEKPYKCDVCQRCFSQKINLTNHVRIHTGEKPYKCDVCQRGFSQKSPLTNHIIIHTGEKPYKCDVCQRSFNGKATLTKHIRIHSGIRPYKCDVCQHSFTQKINLTKHIRIHTGEKPYKCDICLRSFSQKIHLTKHNRIHTCASPTN